MVVALTGKTNRPALALLGLVANHAYTVWAYDANTQIVTLRNPHAFGEFNQPNRDLLPPDDRNLMDTEETKAKQMQDLDLIQAIAVRGSLVFKR